MLPCSGISCSAISRRRSAKAKSGSGAQQDMWCTPRSAVSNHSGQRWCGEALLVHFHGYDGAILVSKTALQPVVEYKDVDQRICRLLTGWGHNFDGVYVTKNRSIA